MNLALRSVVRGVGAHLPERVVANAELERQIDTTDAWIRQRTGICERRIAAPHERTSDLAIAAARAALAEAAIEPGSIDLIVLATTTPDHTFPATAAKVQAALGCGQGAAFDVAAVCAGFVFALATADAFLRTGQAKRALVIGAETMSRLLDWSDRSTCVLFGDGAGALVLTAEEAGETGVLACKIRTDGRQYDALMVDGGVSSTGAVGKLRMDGREVFRQAPPAMAAITREALDAAGLTVGDLDWLAPHQANIRIVDALAKQLEIAPEKVVRCVDRHANTSAASIPLALDALRARGALRSGAKVGVVGMGGGFSWGAAAIAW